MNRTVILAAGNGTRMKSQTPKVLHKAAGRTLVSCVRRNGRTLVAVTLQDGNDWADHATLYEFGFGP